MAFCKKCGAYIPIDETACPACGYDPEAEAKAAAEAKAKAEEEARRKEQEAQAWAAREKAREEEERRRAEQRRRWEERRNQGFTGGAAQTQYTSAHSGQSSASQGQYASQRTDGTWAPPWSQGTGQGNSQSGYQQNYQYYAQQQAQARDSVDKQKLSVLSYLGPLVFIPMVLRSDDDFARFHSNQGLVLMIANGLVSTAAGWLGMGGLAALASGVSLYCVFKGISNVLKGKKEPLPLIGKFKIF